MSPRIGGEVLGKGYMQEGSVRGSWDGEAPPLIIPVDWGGRRLVGAGDWGDWDGGRMGWSGSCRRGSGAGSLEFDIWSCNSRLMVIWRAAMS